MHRDKNSGIPAPLVDAGDTFKFGPCTASREQMCESPGVEKATSHLNLQLIEGLP